MTVDKGRFAPSPSGRMHLGNIMCALLAWLSVKSKGGTLVLRIEDLDTARCKKEYARQLMDDLRWLGLTWEEGPGKNEPDAPYFQSERTEIYENALDRLREKAMIYPCFCSRADLHAANAPHLSDGTVLYQNTCRGLTASEQAEKNKKRPGALRIAVPDEDICFTDGHLGAVCQNLKRGCGDFILRRSDGVFAYQLAVVADDACMGITEVVRGQDLLSSTPRQIYLQRLLGVKTPSYYHIPLLVNEQGMRLSKREKSLDMQELRKRYAPSELLGELAALCGLQQKPYAKTPQELAAVFDWGKIVREPIVVPKRIQNE